MRRHWLLLFLLMASSMAWSQVYAPTFPAVTVSGSVITVANLYGATNTSFEEIPTGSPATVSVTIQGCMRGGTCDSAADTNTSTSATIRGVAFTKPYSYFKITVNWTGGTNVTFTVNPYLTLAKNGSSGGGAVWGSITGTLSSQTDLQTALNLKAPLDSPTFTTAVNLPVGTAGTPSVVGSGTGIGFDWGTSGYLNLDFPSTGDLRFYNGSTLEGSIGNHSGNAIYLISNGTNGTVQIQPAPTTVAGSSSGSVNIYSGNNLTPTSGNQALLAVNGVATNRSFAPTSGSANLNWFQVTPVINQTGTSSGNSTGIFENATLTAVKGVFNLMDLQVASSSLFKVDSSGDLAMAGVVTAPLTTPASSSATCTAGTIVWDASYVYVCTATNTWKRSALSTF